MVDFTLSVRKAVITALRADAGVVALVPAERVFGTFQPEDTPYPFIRYGAPVTTPFNASCIAGSTVEVTVHVFADGRTEDVAANIAAAVVAALDGAVLALALAVDAPTATFAWTGGQLLQDASEPDIHHAYRTFKVDAL